LKSTDTGPGICVERAASILNTARAVRALKHRSSASRTEQRRYRRALLASCAFASALALSAAPAIAGCQSGNGANGTTTFLLDGAFCQGAAPGNGATGVGNGSQANGAASTAVGEFARAKGARATSVGYVSGPAGVGVDGATSIGTGSNFDGAGFYSTAIGAGGGSTSTVSSTGAYSIAIGGGDGADFTPAGGDTINLNGARATGFISTAIGTASEASGGGSMALGLGSRATANDSTAFGEFSTASGASSIAMGPFSTASGNDSVGLGKASTADGIGSLALGVGARATRNKAVAIGAGSLANVANTVSVGSNSLKRRIVNVAPGTQPNDAVNFAQLEAALSAATAAVRRLEARIAQLEGDRVAAARAKGN
jgi:autotransporter adhesin